MTCQTISSPSFAMCRWGVPFPCRMETPFAIPARTTATRTSYYSTAPAPSASMYTSLQTKRMISSPCRMETALTLTALLPEKPGYGGWPLQATLPLQSAITYLRWTWATTASTCPPTTSRSSGRRRMPGKSAPLPGRSASISVSGMVSRIASPLLLMEPPITTTSSW